MDTLDTHDHTCRFAASNIVSAVYGGQPIQKDHPIIKWTNDFMYRIIRAALPGEFLVEIFPVMLHLPNWMARWKAETLKWHQDATVVFQNLLEVVRQKKQNGQARPCFAAHLLENHAEALSNKEMAWLAGTMLGAGAETTAAALEVFMLAMTLYPVVLRKAQAEIDEVVGPYRMSTFSDRDKLPYINAIVKEVLRWRPVGPIGVARRSLADDWYKGYFIPKGSIVLYNVW
ncbi:hypothetical protein HGRIS_007764 [Hohenbuehelia grisea]|uniref:Cytochrome P450 n=1 Tax=Hohenbuehelia grisea TaxID=104357 RepID=A0ABR3J686_9AGAR